MESGVVLEVTGQRDYYQVLGISDGATPLQVKKAYRKMAREYHPDRHPGEAALESMKVVNEAYAVLDDDRKRATYDRDVLPGVRRAATAEAERLRQAQQDAENMEREGAEQRLREERRRETQRLRKNREEAERLAALEYQRQQFEVELKREAKVKAEGERLGIRLAELLFTDKGNRRVEPLLESMVRRNRGIFGSEKEGREVTLGQIYTLRAGVDIQTTYGGSKMLSEWRGMNRGRLGRLSTEGRIRAEMAYMERVNQLLYELMIARRYVTSGIVPRHVEIDRSYRSEFSELDLGLHRTGFREGWSRIEMTMAGKQKAWFVPERESTGK